MLNTFYCRILVKEASFLETVSASVIGQSMKLISLQPLQHRGTAVSISYVYLLMEVCELCNTLFLT
jgi:hypothetical protein